MQKRLQEKHIGNKKEFLREILQEVRVRGNEVKLTDRLPMTLRKPPPAGIKPRSGEFFTVYQLVEAASQCKEPMCTVSFRFPQPARKTGPKRRDV